MDPGLFFVLHGALRSVSAEEGISLASDGAVGQKGTVPRLLVLVTLSLAAAAAGCIFPKAGPAPGPVTSADVDRARYRWPDAERGALTDGRELFVSRCNGCHGYPALTAVPEASWPSIVEKMARKAKLSREQGDHVLRFVLVARVR